MRTRATLLACILLFSFSPKLAAQDSANTVSSSTKNDYSNEDFVYRRILARTAFEDDGTSVSETTVEVLLRSDAGLQRFGPLTFLYQSAFEDIEIPYVRVRKPDGSVVPTPPENIQDLASEVTREAPVYSDLKEKHVAVKGLEKGDVLEYQYRRHNSRPLAPGQFWLEYSFIRDAMVLDEQLEILVPRARAISLKSDEVTPVISEEGNYRAYRWRTSNAKSKERGSEKKRAIAQARGRLPVPQIRLSSFQNWADVGRWYDQLQREKIKTSPEIRAKALELTKNAPDQDTKLHALYNYVSTQYRYIGIAFGIGRYQPHAASEVLSNRYGDCKDKHTLFASLLDAVGIRAYPALISSSHEITPEVPSPAQFDHVITVIPRGSDLLWLDTTPEITPFGYLLPSLRDKHALVVSADKPAALITTPADPPFPMSLVFKVDAKLSPTGTLESKMERSDRGDMEFVLRTAFRRYPQSQWKDLMQKISLASGFGGTVNEVVASPAEATDKPFHISYSYLRQDYGDWENKHTGAPLPFVALPILDDGEQPTEPLWLGSRQEVLLQARMEMPKGFDAEIIPQVNLNRDFAEYHSSYSFSAGVLTAERRLLIKKPEIPVSQYEDYKTFRKAVVHDWERYMNVSFASASTQERAASSFQNTVWSMPDSTSAEAMQAESEARDDIRRSEHTAAAAALKRAVAADPKFTRAWLLLGTVLLSHWQLDEGLDALHKAIACDPQLPAPHKVLGYSLLQFHMYSDAVPVWQEFVKLAPDDVDGPMNLASAFISLKRYSDAAVALEGAAKLSPQRANVQTRLGSAYLLAGDEDKALIAFKKALELNPGADTQNTFAYELAEANKRLPEALEYAEEAVRSVEEQSAQTTLSSLKDSDLRVVSQLAAYWDTLGWVHFRMENLGTAEKYLLAAWNLSLNPTIADHLGQVYEKQHKNRDAIHMYKLALGQTASRTNGRGDMEDTRRRLSKLVPGIVGPTSYSAADELSRLRSTHISGFKADSPGSAEFFLLFSAGRVRDVKFISGSEKLRIADKALRITVFNMPFPDEGPTVLARRGMLYCSKIAGCDFILYTPDTVHKVN